MTGRFGRVFVVCSAVMLSAAASRTWGETITFEGLPRGTVVSNVSGDAGSGPITVLGANSRIPGRNAAVIFDSSHPTGDDADLGTPNQAFGGPGIGAAGASGPFANRVALGNILIIDEHLTDANNDGRVDDPDDNAARGKLTIDFRAIGPVTMSSITYLDIEPTEVAPVLKLRNMNDGLIRQYTLPRTGNNGVNTFDLGTTAGVGILTIDLAGSGAVDNIVFLRSCGGIIGDLVWDDMNCDGLQDAGERGIPDVTVNLKDASGAVIATDITDADGKYGFNGLCPGDYTVEVDESNLPIGYIPTDSNVGGDRAIDSNGSPASVTLTASHNEDLTIDFGYKKPGSIGDRVWLDTDCDGEQEPGEPGLAGITVILKDDSGATLDTTTTDADGIYRFEALCAGTYVVEIDPTTVPTGYTLSFDPDGGDDGKARVVLITGEDRDDIDFGYCGCDGIVGDLVWNDVNCDGLQTANEAGIPDVTVNLKNAAGSIIATTVTDADGKYKFEHLCAGEYTVEVDASTLPPGFVPTDDRTGGDRTIDSNGSPASVNLSTNNSSDLTIDFGYIKPGSIGDRIWSDTDCDGEQEPGEPGLAGIRVLLKNEAGVTIDVTTTDGDGGYRFGSLCAGTWTIEIDPTSVPSGYTLTFDPEGSADGKATVILIPGDDRTDIDFGYCRCGRSLGDFVWSDTNSNGVQDAGEPGVGNVTVRLMDCNNSVLDTTTTNGNGLYGFSGLAAGQYRVVFTMPSGFSGWTTQNAQGADPNFTNNNDSNVDSNGRTACITVSECVDNPTIDAGLIPGTTFCIPDDCPPITGPGGTLFVSQDADFVYVRFTQSTQLNDNSYGAGIVGWPRSRGFSALVGSDKAQFIFKNAAGQTVLDFASDYITATTDLANFPSGWKSFGPFGGDGRCNSGDCTAWVAGYSTSLQDDLNTLGYCANGACVVTTPGGPVDLEVNSPPTTSSTSYDLKYPAAFPNGWNFANSYWVKVSKAAFGASGYGSVTIGLIHNSPPKGGCQAWTPVECPEPPCTVDTDNDGTPDCTDNCPTDPNKTTPGNCGCGQPETPGCGACTVDTDSDGTPDCNDGCPTDPNKTNPGNCGCGQPEGDCGTDECLPNECPPINGPAGKLLVSQDASFVYVTYNQSTQLNDNSYGAGSVGWARTHTFGNLTGSDKAQFIFKNGAGQTVLDFTSDYISATSDLANFPSGWKSFGPTGGDGRCNSGNCAAVVGYSSSLAENLNTLGYCANGACVVTTPGGAVDLEVNSPPTTSSTSYNLRNPASFPGGWNFNNTYSVKIDKSVFGASGFGSVSMGEVHNSPPKGGCQAYTPVTCPPSCTTDGDSDGTPDCSDGCPSDPNKTSPGNCGCGQAETPGCGGSNVCSLVTGAVTTNDKKVNMPITNNGTTTATLSGVTLTWPSTNGKLRKIKLDGDTAWSGDLTSPANITSGFASDANKKSIAAGRTRTFTFEFERNAATGLSQYSGAISFGPNCTITFPPR